jgi:transcriptional regulator with XRE-family HTH domain
VFDIGASLAAARESRGLSLADAERLTCVRSKYLVALEADNFDALPGRTYARAFLRTYASALGLDADKFVAAFEEAIPEPEDEPIAVVTPRRRPRVRGRHLLAIAALTGIAVIVTVAATSRTSTTSPPPVSPPPIHETKVLAARHTKPTQTPVVHQAAVPQTLVVSATRGDCWVQVRRGDSSGAVLYEGTLHQGGALRFGAATLWLRLGAPASVDVTRGGQPLQRMVGSRPLNITV